MTSHRVAVIEQVTNALRKTFDADFPDPFKALYTGPNFQMTREKYPAIYVRYNEQSLQNIGLGHFESGVDKEGMDRLWKHWLFRGSLQFTVSTFTAYERDLLMDALVDVIAFGKDNPVESPFWNEIFGYDFIWLVVNTENILPGGVTNLPAPWQNENEIIFTGSYSVDVTGEFYSDADTSELVPIRHVNVYPFRSDQPVPTGADDPATWN